MHTYYKKAKELDKNDKLAYFRNQFVHTDQVIYLDGNSLGKLPKKTMAIMNDIIQEQWGNRLIRSWNEKWIDIPLNIAGKIAKIIGAKKEEIFVGDTTSLNLYKLVFATLKVTKERTKIISDTLNFPSDIYVLRGIIENHFKCHSLQLLESEDGLTINEDAIQEKVDHKTALITLSYVTYKSSFMYDMQQVNSYAHQKGSLVIWDLSHAAGSVPVHLNETNADMAIGCTYKYLNGGPGAPAFLYIRKDLQEKLFNPIWSWFSHEKPFDFNLNYEANHNIQKFAISTPSILSLAAIEPGLNIIIEAGIQNLREKSIRQSRFLLELFEKYLIPLGFNLASPSDENRRGSHISIQHKEGYRINRAMIEPQKNPISIIPDFRPPNNIRIGLAPLYNTYMDIYETIKRIKSIIEHREYEKFSKEKLIVT